LEENVKSSLQKRLHVNRTDSFDNISSREAAAGRLATIAAGEFGVRSSLVVWVWSIVSTGSIGRRVPLEGNENGT